MKIAIHHTAGSFSERWIEYCVKNEISYKIVNAYDSDIIQKVNDCTAFMWHHHHANYKDVLFAKQLLYSLQMKGIKVFPDFNTTWHFDDKVGQKYLLEAIGAPLVPSYVFYAKKDALDWVNETSFPKVFKLRGGAGAANVKLVTTKRHALRLVRKAFGKGFSQFDRLAHLKEQYRRYKLGKETLFGVIKGVGRLVIPTEFAKMHGSEKGYVYFQDFIEENSFDIRIVIVGDKAFGLKRLIRKDDFRASGSGDVIYTKEEIDVKCIHIAFEVNKKINSQSIAYDFIFDREGNPMIVEISYGFAMKAYDACEGYWDSKLIWYDKPVVPQEWMIEGVLA